MNRRIGVVLSYVLMILEVLSTLLLTPYILRTLGQAEYGVYRLAGSIVSYLLLLDLGVGNALIRFFSKYRANNDTESRRKFMGVSIIYYGVISFVALVLGLILVFVFPTAFAEGLAQSEIVLGQKLLFVTTLTACVTLLTSPFSNSLIAYEKFAVHRVASIIQIIIKMIFTYILLKLGMGSMGIVCVNFVLTLLGRGCFVVYAFVKIKIIPLFKGLSFVFVKEIIVIPHSYYYK
jgi:O-antigen/teichoic acid export membrane protein